MPKRENREVNCATCHGWGYIRKPGDVLKQGPTCGTCRGSGRQVVSR